MSTNVLIRYGGWTALLAGTLVTLELIFLLLFLPLNFRGMLSFLSLDRLLLGWQSSAPVFCQHGWDG